MLKKEGNAPLLASEEFSTIYQTISLQNNVHIYSIANFDLENFEEVQGSKNDNIVPIQTVPSCETFNIFYQLQLQLMIIGSMV